MEKKQLIVSGLSQMPALIKKLWGPPPIPRAEDPAVYWKLGLAMAQAVLPADPIEWMYLKDVVDYTWEIRRLRKYKVELIAIQERSLLSQAREVVQPKEMRQLEEHFAMGFGESEAFFEKLESFESINRLLDVAESRRTATLNDIASYRKNFARHLRKASDDIIEGQFTEHDPGRGVTAGGALDSKATNGLHPSEATGGVPATTATDGLAAGDVLVSETLSDVVSLAARNENAIRTDDPGPGAAAGGVAATSATGHSGSDVGGDKVRKAPNEPMRREVA
jgi:hypothetical protein